MAEKTLLIGLLNFIDKNIVKFLTHLEQRAIACGGWVMFKKNSAVGEAFLEGSRRSAELKRVSCDQHISGCEGSLALLCFCRSSVRIL